jgi:hypothetical protein
MDQGLRDRNWSDMRNEGQEPVGDADTSYHDTELKEFLKEQEEPSKEESPPVRDKGYMQRPEKHPNFWFVWSDVPEKSRDTFLKRLSELLGLPWIRDANVEKSSANISILISLGGESVSLELDIDAGSLEILDSSGNSLLEVTAREIRKKIYCFSKVLCNRKRGNNIRCFQAAIPNSYRCEAHQALHGDGSQRKSLAIRNASTYMNMLPANAYYHWTTKRPELAKLANDIAESFRLELKWDFTNPRLMELKYLAVQIVTRNLMHNKVLEADFKSAVYDPESGGVVGFKAHFLLDKVTAFDSRVMQKLKDFGLIVPPSRTDSGNAIPIELRLLWTPMPPEKARPSIDVEVKVVDAESRDVKDVEDGNS